MAHLQAWVPFPSSLVPSQQLADLRGNDGVFPVRGLPGSSPVPATNEPEDTKTRTSQAAVTSTGSAVYFMCVPSNSLSRALSPRMRVFGGKQVLMRSRGGRVPSQWD